MSKVLYLCGPPLGGKSFINTKISLLLMSKNIQFGNVNFEQIHSLAKLYKDKVNFFYFTIDKKLSEFDLVIAESVNLNGRNDNDLVILCLPSKEIIKQNYESYKLLYGTKDIKNRLCSGIENTISLFMNTYRPKKNTIIFNGKNIDYILEKVVEYVISN